MKVCVCDEVTPEIILKFLTSFNNNGFRFFLVNMAERSCTQNEQNAVGSTRENLCAV